ncbi:MAG: flagellin [Oleispira sp.]|jgi:flagellin
MTSINSSNNFVSSNNELSKTFSQVSSGKRINSAADDAAGLAIATRFSSQISGTQQAQRNGLDAKSLIETEDGALEQISNGILRLQELAVQQGNGILNDSDRAALNKEASQISNQINQVIEQSSFNGKDLFQQSSDAQDLNFQLGDKAGDVVSLAANTTATPIQQGLDQLDFSSDDSANNLEALDAIQQQVTERRSELGAVSNRIDSSVDQLANKEEQTQAARSRVEDADIAELVSQMVVERVKQQAQLAVQSQANASAEDTLRLLS